MFRWGLIVAGLLVLGSLPLFVGLAFVLPWLGYSTWHLYTRLIDRDAIPGDAATSRRLSEHLLVEEALDRLLDVRLAAFAGDRCVCPTIKHHVERPIGLLQLVREHRSSSRRRHCRLTCRGTAGTAPDLRSIGERVRRLIWLWIDSRVAEIPLGVVGVVQLPLGHRRADDAGSVEALRRLLQHLEAHVPAVRPARVAIFSGSTKGCFWSQRAAAA